MTIEAICEQGFAPALAAVESGRIPGAALGVVCADDGATDPKDRRAMVAHHGLEGRFGFHTQ